MTIYRARVLDTPQDPFAGGALRCDEDVALRVDGGVITERGRVADVSSRYPGEQPTDLRGGLLLPGLIDTHVHYPQVRCIGGFGLSLLDWLEQRILPEEARLADPCYAADVARDFVSGLLAAGTTTALVFGSHFPAAMDALFTEATARGLRMTSGLVTGDRGLIPPLLTSPERAYRQACDLAARWHGVGHTRYAVTPRFSLSSSPEMLKACSAALRDIPGSWFTSHVNESRREVQEVAALFPDARDYVDTYDRYDLLGPAAVLAHNVHPTDRELCVLGERRVTVSHCPSSNLALGSGLFPLQRHLRAKVPVSLGTDVGAGTGFSLLKEGLQAYLMQRAACDGISLSPASLLYLATRAGALALGLDDLVGDLSVGKAFDAVLIQPSVGSTLATNLAHATDADDALARVFALATPADITAVWIAGAPVSGTAPPPDGRRRPAAAPTGCG